MGFLAISVVARWSPSLIALVSGNTVGNAGGGVFGECGAGTRCGSSGVTLTSSTVSGNTAGKDGGGIFNDAFHQSIVTFINSTVSGNTAGSGYSGGGVLSDGTTGNEVTLVSSILAGNVAGGTANDCEMSSGSATASYSLIQASAKACGVTDGASNNRVGVNLRLAVLADNGCATLAGTACVQTHALQAGSLALDTGSNPNDLITDQRGDGYPRQRSNGIDMGAFEGESNTGAQQTATSNCRIDITCSDPAKL